MRSMKWISLRVELGRKVEKVYTQDSRGWKRYDVRFEICPVASVHWPLQTLEHVAMHSSTFRFQEPWYNICSSVLVNQYQKQLVSMQESESCLSEQDADFMEIRYRCMHRQNRQMCSTFIGFLTMIV